MKYIDLHVHTTASDGTVHPGSIAKYAKARGLSAIAVTDHDTVSGIIPAKKNGEACRMEVISGIELSSLYDGKEIHILGYFIDPTAPALLPVLEKVVENRNLRNRKIIQMLQSDGYPISQEAINSKYSNTVIGRPHIAEYLFNAGSVPSIADAFNGMLSKGKKYYIPRSLLSIKEAMASVINAGGLPVLAHPILFSGDMPVLDQLVSSLLPLGLAGIEAFYSKYTPDDETKILSLAEKYHLVPTGGSDFHGSRKPDISIGTGRGNLAVPYSSLEMLKKKRDN